MLCYYSNYMSIVLILDGKDYTCLRVQCNIVSQCFIDVRFILIYKKQTKKICNN